jgi:hypothetical protein
MPHVKRDLIDDDLMVRKDQIDALFNPHLGQSTFYKKVASGEIVKCRIIEGFYMLNATRRNLGLPPVDVEEYRRKHELDVQIAFPIERRLAVVAMSCIVEGFDKLYPPSFFPQHLNESHKEFILAMVKGLKPFLDAEPDYLLRLFMAGGMIWSADFSYTSRGSMKMSDNGGLDAAQVEEIQQSIRAYLEKQTLGQEDVSQSVCRNPGEH